MPVRKSSVIASLSIVSALGLTLGIVTNRSDLAVVQERFGQFTAHDVISLTKPVVQAILPDRNNLYVTTEHRNLTMEDGLTQRVWNLDYTDESGASLIHITCDANTGRIAWLGYDWHIDHVTPHPVSLTAYVAAIQARDWMRLLGYQDDWQLADAPQRRARTPQSTDADWSVRLQKPGWRAQLVMNEAAGTLVYANVVPAQRAQR